VHDPLDFTIEMPSGSFKISDHVLFGFAAGVGNAFDRAAQMKLNCSMRSIASVPFSEVISVRAFRDSWDGLRRARRSEPSPTYRKFWRRRPREAFPEIWGVEPYLGPGLDQAEAVSCRIAFTVTSANAASSASSTEIRVPTCPKDQAAARGW
jgi:hypothetical protein